MGGRVGVGIKVGIGVQVAGNFDMAVARGGRAVADKRGCGAGGCRRPQLLLKRRVREMITGNEFFFITAIVNVLGGLIYLTGALPRAR